VSTAAAPTGYLGLSHLGIISGIGWASFGQPVLAVDPDAATVDRLARGDLPVREPGLPELLARSYDYVTFSSDLARLRECPLVIVACDVPTDAENTSHLQPVLDLIDQAVPHLRPDVVLVVMSQVPAGFTRALGERIRAMRPDLSFSLYYWVETLIFGDAVRRCLEPERFMVGCADPAQPLPAVFLAGLERFGCPILPMTYESAELTKTAINLYLVGSVTYANLFADLCEAIGADWSQMVPALRLDKRIGPAAYIRPSLGVAGGNLERDLVTVQRLCREHGVDCGYLDAMIDSNARRFDWIRRKLRQYVFDRVAEPQLALWGLTYKRNTHSTKNSPALRLIEEVGGRARLRAWDPVVGQAAVGGGVTVLEGRDAVLADSDCLLIMADWDDFAAADLSAIRTRMRRPVVIDSVAILESRRGEMDGIEYVSMGR
jgi:UDPglucose 6-dehydrogenase